MRRTPYIYTYHIHTYTYTHTHSAHNTQPDTGAMPHTAHSPLSPMHTHTYATRSLRAHARPQQPTANSARSASALALARAQAQAARRYRLLASQPLYSPPPPSSATTQAVKRQWYNRVILRQRDVTIRSAVMCSARCVARLRAKAKKAHVRR